MQRRFAKAFVAVTLIVTICGHWAILQSLAWAGMIVNYAQTDTVRDAISKTFDGKHPCAICKFVKHATQKERKQQSVPTNLKLDPMIQPEFAASALADPYPICEGVDPMLPSRSHLPPLPPPRSA